MRGITLPVTAIVVIAIAVLVFAAIAALFTSTGGTQISRAEAERVFFAKCQLYCDRISAQNNYALAAQLNEKDPEFLAACTAKGVQWKGPDGEIPARCLEACPCDLSTTAAEVNSGNACVVGCLSNHPAGSPEGEACLASCG